MHHTLSHSRLSAERDLDVIKYLAETEDAPYKTHILLGLLYSTLTWTVILSSLIFLGLVISLLTFNSNPSLILYVSSLALFSFSALFTIQLVRGLLLSNSYTYEISPRGIKTVSKAFRLEKMEAEYSRMQDIILSVSLPQHIAGLATIYLDASSNMVWENNKKKRRITPITETIPDLRLRDARILRNKIAGYMGLDLREPKEHLAKKIPLEHIKPFKKTVIWAIILTPPLLVSLVLPIENMVKVVLTLLYATVLVVKYAYEIYYAHHYFYDVGDDFLRIRKGVFGFTEIIVPFSRVQDVYIKEGLLDKLFGLRNVYISTYKNRWNPNTHIDGLSAENANRIAEILLEKSIKKYGH